jgi:hypothetical protein
MSTHQTIKYYYSDLEIIPKKNNQNVQTPDIKVFDGGCFDVLDEYNYNSLIIHNFANNFIQGGPGSSFTPEGQFIDCYPGSQESQIIYTYQNNIILPKNMYPICKTDNPGDEALLYSICGNTLPHVITIASLVNFNINKPYERQTMLNRIKLMLVIAAKYNKHLVTGLWGCGIFGCNPSDIATLWAEAVQDPNIPKPPGIIFAIKIDRCSAKWGNFQKLEKLFTGISNYNQ